MILVVGVALIALFGLRILNQLDYSRKVQSGEIQVETLRGWMTLSYIAHAYGVEETDLRTALGVAALGYSERSLREWIDASGQDPTSARKKVENLIVARRTDKTDGTRISP
ncbi:MAG: hypothetical protein ABL923_04820 [Burkholderiaceae bacterium]